MSKFAKILMMSPTQRRIRLHDEASALSSFMDITEEITLNVPASATEYRVSAKLQFKGFARDGHPDALRLLETRAKRQLVEAVFGEFRIDIFEIERCLYERNFEGAKGALDRLAESLLSPV